MQIHEHSLTQAETGRQTDTPLQHYQENTTLLHISKGNDLKNAQTETGIIGCTQQRQRTRNILTVFDRMPRTRFLTIILKMKASQCHKKLCVQGHLCACSNTVMFEFNKTAEKVQLQFHLSDTAMTLKFNVTKTGKHQ